LLGFILLRKQDYAGAAEAWRAYLQLSPRARDVDQIRARLDEIDGRLAANSP
jgi:regulator of sirC expression with transglutaminase-like and TPR domain